MAAEVSRLPSRPARPTIEVGGQRNAVLEAALLSYELGDSLESMARAELAFGNWGGENQPGFQHFDRRTLEFGKALKVTMNDAALFEGRITALGADFPEGAPPTMTVLAEDRLQDLRMTRRTRCFSQASLGDVIRRIASDHGLQAEIRIDAPAVPLLVQLNQSDLAFLFDTARRFDVDIHVSGTKLRALPARTEQAVKLAWAGTLRSFNVVADLAGQRSAIVASGWNVARKRGISQRGAKAAIQSELGSDQPAADILPGALGERVDTLAHALPRSADEARQLAEASYRHMARSFVTGEGQFETEPEVRVGAKLELKGLGPLFDGTYRAISVTHLFDSDRGARTEFRCNRPGLGRP
ncbi:MAG: phage late control D family protein [Sphingomicrobium sp.]